MRIGIIGGGFTGLTAAYRLSKLGHSVTIFEKEKTPGGLALGFKEKEWEWTLEAHYHHWFANDQNVLDLAKEISYDVLIKRPKTSVFVDGKTYQLDDPVRVLTFPKLPLLDRFRMAATLGFLKFNPFWQILEGTRAANFLPITMGEKAYSMLWQPQLENKFGAYAPDISLAWFWARIKKRTEKLVYPKAGFLSFANALVKKIEENGGKVLFNTEVVKLKSEGKVSIKYLYSSSEALLNREVNNETMEQLSNFDKVLVTTPSFFFINIAPQLPDVYKKKLLMLKGIGAINLILRLKKPFFSDNTYWLSICDKKSPIMAIVEHTNFMDKKYYNNEHIVYVGNYFPHNHPYMKMPAEELLKIYTPYLKKINPNFQASLIKTHIFKAPFAQPIIPINYSKIIPPLETPLAHVYLANIQQVYPWDRGTNYAVELGEKVAKLITDK